MQVQYRCMGGQVMLTFEVADVKDLIRQTTGLDEVLMESKCGACESPNVRLRHRVHDKNDYYEVVCQDCRATLSFGQKREGGALFPKRKDKDGNWLDNRGWVKWQRETAPAPQQADNGGYGF